MESGWVRKSFPGPVSVKGASGEVGRKANEGSFLGRVFYAKRRDQWRLFQRATLGSEWAGPREERSRLGPDRRTLSQMEREVT